MHVDQVAPGYARLLDPRFTRCAIAVHAAVVIAGTITTACGLWAAADLVYHRWKDRRA